MNKIKRFKNADKLVKFYKMNFGFTEPIRILMDGTFCLAALQDKINIAEQMPNYMQCAIKLCTSKCILRELTTLGGPMYGALVVSKQFSVIKCDHDKNTSATQCVMRVVKMAREDSSAHKYIICSQDWDLTHKLREIPGVPVIYVKYNTILMEKASDATNTFLENKRKASLMQIDDKKTLKEMKKKENIKEKRDPDFLRKILKKRGGGPNPLSCQKSKRKASESCVDVEQQPKVKKRKRKKKNEEIVEES